MFQYQRRTPAFNDPAAALDRCEAGSPALLKPEHGGSGVRMYQFHSPDEFLRLLDEHGDR
jgi:hypothetical protein